MGMYLTNHICVSDISVLVGQVWPVDVVGVLTFWKWNKENTLSHRYCKRSVSGETYRRLKLVKISGGKCPFYTP